MPVAAQVTLEDAMNLAVRHYNNGNLIIADRTFRDIIQSVPDYHPALHYLGIVCFMRGNIKDAVHFLGEAVTLDKKNANYLNVYAVMLSESGRHEEALKWWDKAIKADPKFPDSYSNKANTLWQLKRYKDAEDYARKALKISPKYPDALLNMGNALVAQGKREEAIKYWERAVKALPNFDKAYNNLGNALRDLGRLKESEAMCLKGLEINPKNAQIWSNLGNARRDLGDPKAAEECYRKATALMPNYAAAHNNLAVSMIDQHRFQDALESARYAIAFNPDYAEAYANMSLALRELGDLEEAEVAAQKAVALQPDSAAHYLDLADILFLSDRFEEAEAALEAARKLTPDAPRVLIKLAVALERSNRPDEALKILDQAIEKAPEFPELYMRKAGVYFMNNMLDEAEKCIATLLKFKPDYAAAFGTLAEIQQSRGNIKESLKSVRKALKHDKNSPHLYFTLAKCKDFTKDDADLKAMEALAKKSAGMGKLSAASLHFALFEAYEDIGDYKKAFAHLKEGNDLKHQTIPHNTDNNRMSIERIKKTYTKSSFKQFEGMGHNSPKPVFIVGMPRSGTTLTEQIISSHPDVFPAGELTTMGVIDSNFANMTPENAAKMGKAYIDRVAKRYPAIRKHKHFTDKMPGNFIRIGQIACILPHAKIIHCRRNPVDTCLSNYKQMFARGQYWSYNLEDLAEQYHLYEDIMAHWRKVMPGQFLEIDYEETVGDLETQARKMIEFIGLPWNDACLSPHKQKRSVLTASKTQVIKPVYTTSVKGWRRYEKQLQPLIKALNEPGKTDKKPETKKPARKKPVAKKKASTAAKKTTLKKETRKKTKR